MNLLSLRVSIAPALCRKSGQKWGQPSSCNHLCDLSESPQTTGYYWGIQN
jgi:hypothetical protein